MNRGQLPARLLPTLPTGNGPERMSGRITICRNTPSNIMSPTRSQPGPSAEVRLGVRGHQPPHSADTAPVKRFALAPTGRPPGDRAPPPALTGQPAGELASPPSNPTPAIHPGNLTRAARDK
jgi:hypothetical protein